MASFYENISGYTVTQTDKAYFTDIDVANEITVNGVVVDLVTLADLVNTPTFTGSISSLGLSVGDNNLINVGAGNDLQIYHDGSHSYIKDAGTGDLKIQGENVAIQNISGGNIFFANSQAAFLDWRGTSGAGTKLQTTANGINVTGTVNAQSAVVITDPNPRLILKDSSDSDDHSIKFRGSDDADNLQITSTGNHLNFITADSNKNILMKPNGTTALQVNTTGIDVTGTVTADGVSLANDKRIIFGAEAGSNYLEIFESTTNSGVVKQVGGGNIAIQGQNGYLQNDAGAPLVAWDGELAELNWQGTTGAGTKLQTTSTGIDVTGTVTADEIIFPYYTDDFCSIETNINGTSTFLDFQLGDDNGDAFRFRFNHFLSAGGYVDALKISPDSSVGTGDKFIVDVTGTVTADGVTVGSGNGQLDITADASNTYITQATTTGNVYLDANNFVVRDPTDGSYRINAGDSDGVKLYSGNAKRVETGEGVTEGVRFLTGAQGSEVVRVEVKDAGIDVTGTVSADSSISIASDADQTDPQPDLNFFNNEDDAVGQRIGQLNFYGKNNLSPAGFADIKYGWQELRTINVTDGSESAQHETWVKNGADGHTRVLQVQPTGIDVTGDVAATTVTVGDSTGTNLELYEDGDQNAIIKQRGTGSLQISGINGLLSNDDYEALLSWGSDAINLSWQGTTGAGTKLSTTSTGIDVTGTVEANAFSGTGTTAITDFITDVSTSNNDTTVPTTAAVKSYVDNNDGDTTYTGGTGLTLNGTTFNVDAAQTQITSVGALNAGSITSGFGDINNGTNSVTTNGVLISDSTSADDTKPELKFYKDVNSATGDFIGEVVFESKDTFGNDTVFAEIRAQAKFSKNNVLNDSVGAIHFNIADATGGGSANLEKPSCIIDNTGVRINTENSDGNSLANYYHVDNINLVTGTQSGGLKFNSHTQDNASNKTTQILSKNITEDHEISVPNVSGSLVVAAIAGGSINGGGGATSPKSTWSESDFTANPNSTYIHYNPLNTTDLTVSPAYPSTGIGDSYKFLNASPLSSEIVIDLDGYTGSSIATYAMVKTDGSLNVTKNTTQASTITVSSGGFVTLTKASFSIYLVEGIGYTYS